MTDLLATALSPLGWVLDPTRGVYWVHLSSAAVIAALLVLRHDGRPARGALRALFPKRVWLHRSTFADLRFWLVDAMVSGAFLAPLVLGSDTVADLVYASLHRILPEGLPILTVGIGDTALFTLAVVVLADLGFFVSHWLRHRVPWLWEFHKVHHSAEVMTPLTGFRIHPVDQLLNGSLAGIGVGVAVGAFDFVYAGAQSALTIAGANAIVFVFNVLGANLRHSHVPLSFGPLDRWIVSPVLHQIHHSEAREHWNQNLGGLLSVWDRLAGTLLLPAGDESLRFGTGEAGDDRYHGVLAMYGLPFSKILGRLRAG